MRFQTPEELKKIEIYINEMLEKYHNKPVIPLPLERKSRINFLESVAKELNYDIRYDTDFIIR